MALDPELLGKVFENLLGTFNPETLESARNATGSFYTPREIVSYMVDSSLKEYFKNYLKDDADADTKLEALFSYQDEGHNFSSEQVEALIAAINNSKILDPACGSGAFPMGILQRLVHILGKLDPGNKLWEDIQRKKAVEETEEAYKIGDTEKRNERLLEISDIFRQNSDDYGRKLFLIENCIYGIDIQPIAIQISKLRFFISLIVNQEKGKNKDDNYGIRPLPNLETKFVAANTLIGIKRESDVLVDPEIDKVQKQLLLIRHQHFNARNAEEKIALRKEDRRLALKLAEILKNDGFYNSHDAEQMAKWNPYDQNTPSDFFDPDWMFGVAEGFDVVVGNPPYIKEGRVLKTVFDGLRGTPYYQGKLDLWYIFACMGIDFLSDAGNLCFIATNNWTTNSGASKLRNKVVADTKILQLVDFSNFMIFESASIQTMVLQFKKDNKQDGYMFDYRKLQGNTILTDAADLLHNKSNAKVEYLKPIVMRDSLRDSFLVFNADENIFAKIRGNKDFLTEKEVAQGVVFPQDFLNKKNKDILGNKFTVGEGIFALSNQEKHDLQLAVKELRLIKPYYTTEQIHRYYSDLQNSLWLIYTDSSFKNPHSMDNYPNLKKHLNKYKNIITSDNKPYGLHRAREESFFKGEKIFALRKCVGQPSFSYSNFDCYVSATFYVIKTERFNMKYLLGLLNSKLMKFWLKNKGKMQGDNFQLDKEPLLAMPLQPITKEQEKPFVEIVDKILAAKAADLKADTRGLEEEIDTMVYAVYGLGEEDIAVVEGKSD